MGKVRPFSNGTEFEQWNEQNCDECKISTSYRDSSKFKCHIDEALITAYFGDGKIKKSIADKIGFQDNLHLKNCPFKNKITYVEFKFNANYVHQLSLF